MNAYEETVINIKVDSLEGQSSNYILKRTYFLNESTK